MLAKNSTLVKSFDSLKLNLGIVLFTPSRKTNYLFSPWKEAITSGPHHASQPNLDLNVNRRIGLFTNTHVGWKVRPSYLYYILKIGDEKKNGPDMARHYKFISALSGVQRFQAQDVWVVLETNAYLPSTILNLIYCIYVKF